MLPLLQDLSGRGMVSDQLEELEAKKFFATALDNEALFEELEIALVPLLPFWQAICAICTATLAQSARFQAISWVQLALRAIALY
uniref:Uncharacterized protein n=1 Tax=Tolypothrix bouteillei VB521301 TaxID=1479485 RepID=A0A0C1NFL0_9CYAN